MTGIIYCLENPAMPDLVKIGKTNGNLEERLRQLYSHSGVPLPFTCIKAVEVDDATQAEKLLHDACGDHRLNANREFFEISSQRVVAAMLLTGGADVTPKADVVEDEESLQALQKRRERFNFRMVGIEDGTELQFRPDFTSAEPITAVVHSHNRITFRGEVTSLSRAAQQLLGAAQGIQGPLYWYYKGECLDDRRRRMEQEGSE